MRVAVTADLHLNNKTYGIKDRDSGLPIKTVDSFRALDFFVSECKAQKVDRVVIAGDVYDNYHPSSDIMEMFNTRLQDLESSGIQVVVMPGNHDASGNTYAISPIKGWSSTIKIVDKPVVENGDGYKAIYVPHTSDIESGARSFPQLLASVRTEREGDEPIIFFGHFSVNGAMRNDYSEHVSKMDVSAGDIESTGATVAFLGHFHKHQKIGTGIPIHYVGSLERHRLDEINGERGFYIFDTETQESTRIPYTGQRPMKKIHVESFDEALADIEDSESWAEHIVRIEFEGDEKSYARIKSNFKELRKEFESRGGLVLKLADVKYAKKEDNDEEETVMSVDTLDLMDMIAKRIKNDFENDKEEQTAIIAMANDVYKKAEVSK